MSHLPGWILLARGVETLDEARRQDGGEFVCDPGGEAAARVGVRHVAEAGARAERRYQEPGQVGQPAHKTLLHRVVTVKDTEGATVRIIIKGV